MIWNAFRPAIVPAIASWFHSISITLRSVRGRWWGGGGAAAAPKKIKKKCTNERERSERERRKSKILSNHKTFLIQKESCLHFEPTVKVSPLSFLLRPENTLQTIAQHIYGRACRCVMHGSVILPTPFPAVSDGGAASVGRSGTCIFGCCCCFLVRVI